MLSGIFITFEGVEGCGKSTQVELLVNRLVQMGHDVVKTREPGGGGMGEEIRDILLRRSSHRILPLTELFFLAANRSQHVAHLIKPALGKGTIVVCDRYIDSSVAYQGYGRGIPVQFVESVNGKAIQNLIPHLTIVIDMDAQISLNRSQLRLKQQDLFEKEGRFETEHIQFHNRVRDGYLSIAKDNSERVILVDGNSTISKISEEIWCHVTSKFTSLNTRQEFPLQ
jgi:dTMP kinase